MGEAEADFVYEKATKNKYRFRETTKPQNVGTIYLNKDLFDGGAPNVLRARFEW